MLGQDVVCLTCHGYIDNVGFAFEGLDAIGRVRDMDNGVDVDVSGHLPSGGGDFAGPVLLAVLAASNAEAQRCMAQQWLAFVLGRSPGSADLASLEDAVRAFAASGFSLRELIPAVLTAEAFLAP